MATSNKSQGSSGKRVGFGLLMLALMGLAAAMAVPDFLAMRQPDLVVPGPGVSSVRQLSDYFPGLAGTAGDTAVYVMEGAEPGGKLLVLGGVHGNEPGGYLAAILLVESGLVDRGSVYVIPFTCASCMTHTDPGEAAPRRFPVETPHGTRYFKYGSRAINPVHSWPDPEVYVHYPSGQRLSGEETRNINRAFPGRPDGSLAERITYGITELIRQEGIDVVIDLHEAMPEYPNINVIVAHQRALEIAADAQIEMMLEGVPIATSPSPELFRGLTHREIGDHTPAFAFLMEAPNITIGRLRGQTTVDTILEGKDDFYVWAGRLGRLFVQFDEKGWPLDVRVARHVTGVRSIAAAFSMAYPDRAIEMRVPGYAEIISEGVGAFLAAPN